MSKDRGYIIIGLGLGATLAFAVGGIVLYNKRQRQEEFDYLMSVIKENLNSATSASLKGSPFDRDLYRYKPNCATIDSTTAKSLSDKLYNAKGGVLLNDDEAAVESVFKNLRNKCDVSRIADHFYNAHGNVDLLVYLQSFLNESEMDKYVFFYTEKLK